MLNRSLQCRLHQGPNKYKPTWNWAYKTGKAPLYLFSISGNKDRYHNLNRQKKTVCQNNREKWVVLTGISVLGQHYLGYVDFKEKSLKFNVPYLKK